MTFPKTTYLLVQIISKEGVRTCLPSSQEVLMVQMKNWDPLVSRPALAMAGGQLRLAYAPLSLAYREHQDQCA